MSFRKAPTRVSATIGGKEIILETGRVATQAHGSVTIQCGGTVVLVTVCSPVSYTHLTLPTKA